MRMVTAWPHLRAAYVLFHMFAVVALCLPRPGQLDDREAWQKPRIKRNFGQATNILRAAGFTLGDDELEDRAFAAAKQYIAVHDVLHAALRPYSELTGVRQGWRLFLEGKADASRLHVDIYEAGRWRPVYVRGSGEHVWLERQLDYHRIRKLCGWGPKKDDEREAFVRWLARRAARDFPAATRMRARSFELTWNKPGDGKPQPKGSFVRSIEHDLVALR